MIIIDILQKFVSTTMWLVVARALISVLQLDKKWPLLDNLQQVLTGFFKPILEKIKDSLPPSKVDYSGVVFLAALWALSKLLSLISF